jgi:putative Mn2+ efflux pump MntP
LGCSDCQRAWSSRFQAFIVTQIGLRPGHRLGKHLREAAEGVAGVALVLLGLALLADKLAA